MDGHRGNDKEVTYTSQKKGKEKKRKEKRKTKKKIFFFNKHFI